MELERKKNVTTSIMFPMINREGDKITGLTELVSRYAYWEHEAEVESEFAATTNSVSEVGSSGWYTLYLTASEMNHDFVSVEITSSNTSCLDQGILIKTKRDYVLYEGYGE
jgi:hypothetical protein